MGRTNTPLVSVCMITYNHEFYIEEAIEGVLMQKTTFPIELIISEDCSTDGTRKIVRDYAQKYPEIIVADLPENNRGMMPNVQYNMSLAKGKYIALCEGDDYWIDPLKLQKQVDFLEANPDYGMCYAQANYYIQNKNLIIDKKITRSYKDLKEFLLIGNTIPTNCVIIRKTILVRYMSEVASNNRSDQWLLGDLPIWAYAIGKSKTHCLNDVLGVYRKLDSSASSFGNNYQGYVRFVKSEIDCVSFFCEFFNLDIIERVQTRFVMSIICKLSGNMHREYIHDSIADYKLIGIYPNTAKLLLKSRIGYRVLKLFYSLRKSVLMFLVRLKNNVIKGI